jgi:hypothetical protein
VSVSASTHGITAVLLLQTSNGTKWAHAHLGRQPGLRKLDTRWRPIASPIGGAHSRLLRFCDNPLDGTLGSMVSELKKFCAREFRKVPASRALESQSA